MTRAVRHHMPLLYFPQRAVFRLLNVLLARTNRLFMDFRLYGSAVSEPGYSILFAPRVPGYYMTERQRSGAGEGAVRPAR